MPDTERERCPKTWQSEAGGVTRCKGAVGHPGHHYGDPMPDTERERRMRKVTPGGAYLDLEVADEIERLKREDAMPDTERER
jgi:hypothetical protein